MNSNVIRLGIAAAAVVLAIIIGINLLPGPNVGGPGPSPSQTTASSASTAPSVTPANFTDYPDGTALTPGSYAFTHLEPVRVSFTVPSGWEKGGLDWVVWSQEDTKATLAVMTVDNLYVDPCRPDAGLRDPVVGPTVDDLATALGSVPGLTFSTPAEVTRAGFTGKYVNFVPPDTFGECAADISLWSVNGGTSDLPAPTGDDDPYALFVDDTFRVWILDVNGTRLVITTSAPAGIGASRVTELRAMIDSIQIE